MPTSARQASVVSVLNMKGGVGKTTIAASVFRALHMSKKRRILLVDFDPQYNLTQLLVTGLKYEELAAEGRTLLNVLTPPVPTTIFQVADEDLTRTDSVSSYVTPLRFVVSGTQRIWIDLLPGSFRTAAINLLTERASLRVRELRLRSFIQDARNEYDLIVLDCNPSSSFMTRAAIEVSTNLLVPVRPDKYSILGLEMIVDFIANLPTLVRPPDLSIIVNELASSDNQGDVLAELRSHPTYGPQTLANTVPQSGRLEAQASRVGFPNDRGGPYRYVIGRRLGDIADELAPIIGVQ